MDAYLHHESHFEASDLVRDVVIGMADGLTVPFALAAGISGAAVDAHVVIAAGIAEIAAGSIAMGLGGYLAARGEREHFLAERAREEREIVEKPEAESLEVAEIFERYGLGPDHYRPLVEGLRARGHQSEATVDAYMDFGSGQFVWRLSDDPADGYVAASDSRRDGQAVGF